MKLNIHEIIDRIKKRHGFSGDAEVAKTLNISKAALSKHKTRKTVPFKALFAYCEREGISLDWLFTGKGKAFRQEETPDLSGTDLRKEAIIRLISSLPNIDPKKEAIIRLIFDLPDTDPRRETIIKLILEMPEDRLSEIQAYLEEKKLLVELLKEKRERETRKND